MTERNRDCGCIEPVERTPLALDPAPFQSTVGYRVGRHPSFLATMTAGLSASPDLALFTTRDPGDPIPALLDSWATVLDVLSFYQERILNEGFLGTATERRSILELARLIDYELAPGVSAETYLAFSTDDIPNSPVEVQVPEGAKVQSVPFETGELPQTFETSADLVARTPLNDMRLELALYTEPVAGDNVIYLDVADAQLKTGDALVILGDERIASESSRRWQMRRVLSAEAIPEDPVSRQPARTEVTLETPLDNASRLPQTGIRAFAFRQRAGIFGHNAQPWATLPLSLRLGELPPLVAAKPVDNLVFMMKSSSPEPGIAATLEEGPSGIAAFPEIYKGIEFFDNTDDGLIVGPFAGRADTWADAHFDSDEEYIYLDQVYDNVVAGGWLVLRKAVDGGTNEELYHIDEAAEVSHTDFNITAKVTRVRLSGTGLDKFSPRNATVYCASDAVAWARKPIEEPVSGLTLRLEMQIPELVEGQLVAIRGEDATGAPCAMIRTVDSIASVAARGNAEMQDEAVDTTEISLTRDIDPPLVRDTVRINGNVVAANHGETRSEPIGSGNAALAFQVFDLPGRPLTHVSAPGGTGRASTLALRVNDILWKEVPNFLEAGGADRIFRQEMDNEGKVSLTFGDGRTGARLPTGSNNLTATYRVGTGLAGLLDADRLTQPMTRPVGLRAVTNPLATSGAEDPETLDTARQNAPTTVKTLDRIVSLTDYEDFARTFAGIAKASVTSLWDGARTLVHLTISGADGAAFGPEDKTYINLVDAIDAARPRGQPLRIDSGDRVPVTVGAEVWIHPDYTAESVLAEVRASLEAAYCFDTREYAAPLAASEVMARIQAIDGVEGTRFTAFHRTGDADPTSPAPVEALLLAAPAHVEDNEIKRAEILTLAPEDLTLLEAES
jgi:hypothetical protein